MKHDDCPMCRSVFISIGEIAAATAIQECEAASPPPFAAMPVHLQVGESDRSDPTLEVVPERGLDLENSAPDEGAPELAHGTDIEQGNDDH
jgi:hypothetical protein